jgi:predicted O-methyltransferase YrrM
MKLANLLDPTKIENIGERFSCHPGPFPIGYGDLEKIFPGFMEIEFPAQRKPVHGEMNQSEIELLYRVVSWLQPRTMIEVGTYTGNSTIIMAEQSPLDARVLTVDLPLKYNVKFTPYSTDLPFINQGREMGIGSKFPKSLDKNKIRQERMAVGSPQFLESLDDFLGDKKIDFALIDAAHDPYTTEYVFRLLSERINYGGIVMTDDHGKKNHVHPGVTEFFNRVAREEGHMFYWFDPFPTEARDPSGLLYINIEGSIRELRPWEDRARVLYPSLFGE